MSALKSEVNFSSIPLLTESIAKKSVLLKLDSKKVFEKKNKIWWGAKEKTPILR